jgi:hypothetical protein
MLARQCLVSKWMNDAKMLNQTMNISCMCTVKMLALVDCEG